MKRAHKALLRGLLGLALSGLALTALLGGTTQTAVLAIGLPELPFHLRLDSLCAFFLMVIGAAPTRVGTNGSGDHTLQRVLVITLLAILWVVGLALLAEATRHTWGGTPGGVSSPAFARIYPPLYLGVHVVLWAAALPAYLKATDGLTRDGTPIGSGWYALACILACTWFIVATLRATRATVAHQAPQPVAA
mgnify:CR=1 FL=1